MALPLPVPYKDRWWSKLFEKFADLKTEMLAAAVGTKLDDNYYDGEYCTYVLKDQAGSDVWDVLIARQYAEYRYYLLTTTEPGADYTASGFRCFTSGFLEDVLRGTSRSANALLAIQGIIENAAYHPSGSIPDAAPEDSGGARECAYALRDFINAKRAGITLTDVQIARRDQLYQWCLDHCDQWVAGTVPYIKAYQVGITAHALILYYTHVAESPEIITKLKAVSEIIWDLCLDEEEKSFVYVYHYEDHPSNPGGEWEPGEDDLIYYDLNLLISPLYGWLWYQTGIQKYRDRHDIIFEGGQANYDSDGNHLSGSNFGSVANPFGKQLHQQLYWGADGLEWAESEPRSLTGAYDFTLQRNEIIHRAFRIVGKLPLDEVLEGAQLRQGIDILNSIVKSWQSRKSFLWTLRIHEIETEIGVDTYSLEFFDPPIIWIDKASVLIDYDEEHLEVYDLPRYFDIREKTQTGRAEVVCLDRRLTPTLYVWPVPDEVRTIKFLAITKLPDMDDAAGSPEFPERYIEALVFALAYKLSPEYGVALAERKWLKSQADEELGIARGGERAIGDTEFVRGAY